jgi:Pyruvate/2-oxoacid:ferredoxin oxidoreductase delta subunit
MKTTRKTIRIDDNKCVGCEQCVHACQQGALAMVDGKAKLVDPNHCDGLGVCIGECPFGAIEFIEETTESDQQTPLNVVSSPSGGGCPGQAGQRFEKSSTSSTVAPEGGSTDSSLQAWPIQLHLIQPTAPQFQGADLLIAATCGAFAHGGFHQDLLEGRALAIACPKLDRQEGYFEKLVQLFRQAKPKTVTIARMEVPCCQGLTAMVRKARDAADSQTPIEEVNISLQGKAISRNTI